MAIKVTLIETVKMVLEAKEKGKRKKRRKYGMNGSTRILMTR